MNRNILLENLGLCDINPLQCGEAYGYFNKKPQTFQKDVYVLAFIMSGSFEMRSNIGTSYVKSGQILFIRPNTKITCYCNNDKHVHYIWVAFECGLPADSLPNSELSDAPDTKYIFLDIAGADNIRNGRELYICGKIYQLLSLLQYRNAPEEKYAQRYVRMATNFIETNYKSPLRVDTIAAQLNIDRAYFSKIFKKEIGESPQEYIVNYRLSKAAELLRIQNLTPGEVAPMVGYNDLCHFSRIFKQQYGMPPSKYRDKKAEDDKNHDKNIEDTE